MAVNPIIPGTVTARKYASMSGAMTMNANRQLNGTTAVNVFGSTNGISGTAYLFKVYSGTDANHTVTLESGGSTVATVVSGSAGTFKHVDLAALAFTAGGTMGIKSTLVGDTSVCELTWK